MEKTNKKTVSYYIDKDLDKKVTEAARKRGVSKNKIIEELIKSM